MAMVTASNMAESIRSIFKSVVGAEIGLRFGNRDSV